MKKPLFHGPPSSKPQDTTEGRKNGITKNHSPNPTDSRAIRNLKLFLAPSLTEPMTCNTNTYAAPKISGRLQRGGRSGRKFLLWSWVFGWDRSLHGSTQLSGSPRLLATYGLNPAHPVSENMGQTRFKKIKRYFHVSSPDRPKETPLGRRLWHSKVYVVLDQPRASPQRYRVLSSCIAVDKCMMRAIGCPPDTYKKPNRPME